MDFELVNKKLQEGLPLTDEEQAELATTAQDGNQMSQPKESSSSFMQRLIREINPLPSAHGSMTDEYRIEPSATAPELPVVPSRQPASILPPQPVETPIVQPVQQPKITQPVAPSVIKPSQPVEPGIDFLNKFQGGSDEELKAAQDLATKNRMFAQLAGAAAQIGSGIAKVDYSPQAAKALEKAAEDADIPVANLLQRRKAAGDAIEAGGKASLENPDSPESKLVVGMLQKIGMNVPKGISAGQLKRAGIDVDKMLMLKEVRDAKASEKATKPVFSKGQEAVDRKFAAEYNDFVVNGGHENVKKSLDELKDSENLLTGGNVSGAFTGMMPESILAAFNSNAITAKEQIQSVIMKNLRATFGPQFTDAEGKRLMAQTFNPSLDEKENLKRLQRLRTSIEGAAQAKLNAVKYFEENGTLAGFKGTLVNSIDDLQPKDEKSTTISKDTDDKTTDPKIEQWAKQHSVDYTKAEQILRARGYGK